MNEFSQYQPSHWLIDGILVNQKGNLQKKKTLMVPKNIAAKSRGLTSHINKAIFSVILATGLASSSNSNFLQIKGSSVAETSLVSYNNQKFFVNEIDISSTEDNELHLMGKFLSFLDHQIETRPDLIVPADEEQLQRISDLLIDA